MLLSFYLKKRILKLFLWEVVENEEEDDDENEENYS